LPTEARVYAVTIRESADALLAIINDRDLSIRPILPFDITELAMDFQ
jgi:hypothetical protein